MLMVLSRDANGNVTYGRQPADLKVNATLVAASEATYTLPSSYPIWDCIFSYGNGASVWVAINNTAAVPVGATLATTNSELTPSVLQLKAGDVIHVITAETSADFGISIYVHQQ